MKIELVLLLYDKLVGGETVPRKKFCGEHGISERTFYRYLREVSEFLRVHKPSRIVDVTGSCGEYFLRKV